MSEHVDDMREGRERRKRSLLVTLVIALVAVLLVGGTFAYFVREGSASAPLTFSGTRVEIINSWNAKNGSGSDGAGLKPGDRVNDTVLARNVGGRCYLRVRMRITTSDTTDVESTTRVDPTQLKTLSTPKETLSQIVGTLYLDHDPQLTTSVSQSGGLTPSPFTPTYGAYDENNVMRTDAANVLSTNASRYKRSDLVGNKSLFGYIETDVNKYAVTRDAARSAADVYDTGLGEFRNATTKTEYENGLFTFEYVGTNASGGRLGSAEITSPLFTTICVPFNYESTPNGGIDTNGDARGYTISFWAESVPADDFEDVSGDDAKFVAAMKRLDDVYLAENYYPSSS